MWVHTHVSSSNTSPDLWVVVDVANVGAMASALLREDQDADAMAKPFLYRET